MNLIGMHQITVLALATAAISVTISKAGIFGSAREWLAKRNAWLGKLVSCAYCTCHWVAIAFFALFCPVAIEGHFVANFVVSVFVMVALAAIVAGAIIKLTPFQVSSSVNPVGEELQILRNTLEAARRTIVEQQRVIEELRK